MWGFYTQNVWCTFNSFENTKKKTKQKTRCLKYINSEIKKYLSDKNLKEIGQNIECKLSFLCKSSLNSLRGWHIIFRNTFCCISCVLLSLNLLMHSKRRSFVIKSIGRKYGWRNFARKLMYHGHMLSFHKVKSQIITFECLTIIVGCKCFSTSYMIWPSFY